MIEVKELTKVFDSENGKVEALKDISFKIDKGNI